MNAASRLTDRVVAARSARMAGVLRARGIVTGDCVALALPDVPEREIAVYGTLRLGAVVAELDTSADLERGLALVAARLLVAWHNVAEEAEAAAAGAGVDVLFVAPGEFDRLLDGAEPLRAVYDRDDADPALRTVGPSGVRVRTHAELR